MSGIVALLRASGGYSTKEVAGALQLSEKTIRELSVKADPYYARTRTWNAESIARQVLEFYEEEGRFPNSKDFRDWNMRKNYGLPSWDNLNAHMRGFDTRRDLGWAWRSAMDGLIDQGLLPEGATDMPNGWVLLQRWMVQNDRLTPEQILRLPNALMRREGIERYGFQRMIEEGHAERVSQTDPIFGTLWRFSGESPKQPMVMLEVVNRTAEPDGSYAHYFLRVPPEMTVPRQAAAWTFDVTTGWEHFEYEVES